MKHLVSIATILFAVSLSMAQNVRNLDIVSAPLRIMQEPAFSPQMMRQETGNSLPDFSTYQVNAQKIGSSSNYFGYANNGQKQSYILKDLDAVAFIFRNNSAISGAGTSGNLRYNISNDRGLNWAIPNTGAGIGNLNVLQNYARYPDCFLLTNPINGAGTADARFGGIAASLDPSGVGWVGYVKMSVAPNIFTNIITPNIEQEVYESDGPVFVQSITERVPGEFWATMYSESDTIYIMKGAYTVGQGVQWAIHQKLFPNWNLAIDSAAHWTMPKIAFSPAGDTGYVALLGDLVGGDDSIYMPILWEYNLSTDYFSGGYEVPINIFPQLSNYISSFTDTSGVSISNGRATTAFNFDLSVDYLGNPHILCIVGPASSGVFTNMAAYSISSGFALQVMDITKDYTNGWNMIELWDQQTFREDLPSATASTSLDPSMNLARSEDGKYIFYTWSDTDTTGNPSNNANDAPNLKGRFYAVEEDSISPVVDWTYNDAVWVGNARGPKTPYRVFETGSGTCPGRTFSVPTTVCNIPSGDPATVTDFFYFDNINYDCQDANIAPRMFYTCAMGNMSVNSNITSPTNGLSNGVIDLSNVTGGIAPYTYQLLNISGVVVGINNPFTNLSAGFYTAIITDSFGCELILPISLNSMGSLTAIISNQIDPTCPNNFNGTATVCWTGGTNPIMVEWYANNTLIAGGVTVGTCNTHSQLPNGMIVVQLTDANGLIATASTTLSNASLVSFASTMAVITCKDAADGSIIMAMANCNGTATYSWSVPAGMANPGNTNILVNAIPGTYIGYATCLSSGCTFSDTFLITEPVQLVVDAELVQPNTTCISPYNGMICINAITGGNQGNNIIWQAISGNANPYIPTPDQNNPNCMVELPGGTYNISVSDSKGCTTDTVITIAGCQVGIVGHLNVQAFKAYPNPAATTLTIEMTLTKADNVQIALVNIAGQTLMSKDLTNIVSVNEQFNVANLAKGIYFLKVTTSEGAAVDKVVIE